MNDYGLRAVESGESLALRGVEVSSRIAGLLAETSLTQKYRNDTGANLELVYTFPLPVDATLLSFSVRIGERQYHGEVIPRKDAEVAYEKALPAGHSAFRLQEIRPGMYNAALGNVMAGESVEMEIRYAETLAWNGKSVRYRLPTTIAPRYGAPSGMQPWQRPETRLTAEYPLALVITIAGVLAQSVVACPSQPVSFKPGIDSLQVILAAGAALDRDFILDIENGNVHSLGLAASARDTHVAILTLLPPAVEDRASGRDTVLLIDCSGSMQGDSLALAKEGVQLALGSLQPDERFAVVGFGSHFVRFDQQLQPASRQNLGLAHRFVDSLGNLGGTELSGALELALAYADGRPLDILVLTDGEVWNLDGAIAKACAQGVRIFSVGIGSAVAEDTVRALADKTGGCCELVAPNEDMSARIFRHFKRMRQPQLSRLDIRWPGAPLWESRPERSCFAGDAYTVVAAFAEPPVLAVKVGFEFSGAVSAALEVPLAIEEAAADAIVRLAARQRLREVDEGGKQAWALKYQLTSDRTDYLVSVERAAGERAQALPGLQVVPQMLPAGWGGTSSLMGVACAELGPDISHSMAPSFADVDFDHPVVCRKGRSSAMDGALAGSKSYAEFLEQMQRRAARKLLGSIPESLKALRRMTIPDEIIAVIEAMRGEGEPERDILCALYEALRLHAGRDLLGAAFAKKAGEFIGSSTPRAALVTRFAAVVDELLEAQRKSSFGELDRYDIPDFLRRAAD